MTQPVKESPNPRRQNRSERPSGGHTRQSDRQRRPAPFGPRTIRARRPSTRCATVRHAPGQLCAATLCAGWHMAAFPVAVRRAAYTLMRRAALAPWHPVRDQSSSALPPVASSCRAHLLPLPASAASRKRMQFFRVSLVSRVRPAPYPLRLWRSSVRAGALPPASAAASARALLRLVTAGFHGWCAAWRRGAAGCGGVRLAPRGGAAAAAGAGAGVAAALPARVAFPAPAACGASLSAGLPALAVWCAPRAQLVARGPPRAAALLRPWWLAAAVVVGAASGLLDAAALAALKGARLPGARPYVSRARYSPARAGRATAVMPPQGGMGYRNGQKPPENGPNRHQTVTKSPCTILQKRRELLLDQLICR